ncbi:MAG: ATP-binding cassette domain-containing protein [Atopobiaceae bacterium]|nr:ATP-binding cassette domain-containing protein [Atopobiaceae bacterium]
MRSVRRVVATLAWLGIWQLASMLMGNHLLLAGPIETVQALLVLLGQGGFWLRVLWSLARIAAGFMLAFVLALALAGIAAVHEAFADFLHPAMLAIKSTPVVCIVVLLLIWFGSRIVSAVSVFLVVLPAIYFSSLEAIRALDTRVEEMLSLYRVPRLRRILAFVWPSMQPFLLASCEMVVGMSWKAGVAAELIGAPAGSIGERIYQSKILFETADLFAWTIVVVAMAWVSEKLFLALLKASGDWSLEASLPTYGGVPTRFAPKSIGLSHASASFDGERVFEDASVLFPASSRTCLRDPSGAGKTTLLRVLAGLHEADGGEVARARCSFAFQEVTLIEGMDAHGNVALVAGEHVPSETIDSLLAELLPAEALSGPVSELSGGQRRRVELVRAIAFPSEAVLLDEPFVSLDKEAYENSARFVSRYLDERTLVVATHNDGDAAALAASEVRLFS